MTDGNRHEEYGDLSQFEKRPEYMAIDGLFFLSLRIHGVQPGPNRRDQRFARHSPGTLFVTREPRPYNGKPSTRIRPMVERELGPLSGIGTPLPDAMSEAAD